MRKLARPQKVVKNSTKSEVLLKQDYPSTSTTLSSAEMQRVLSDLNNPPRGTADLSELLRGISRAT